MSAPINTVLVTGVGGPAGASVCRQLRAAAPDVRIIATDIREVDAPADVFLLGPRADSAELIPFLTDVIATHDVDLLIPTVQDELPAVAAAAPGLECVTVMGSLASISICHDKLLTASYLEAVGLGVPWTRVGTLEPVEYPLVAKPRVARGGRGVTVATTPGELPELDAAMITQGFAPGVEYCAQAYSSPHDGFVEIVVLEKTELREGSVGNATRVRRITPEQAPDIHALAEEVTRKLHLRGPLDMDIRRESDGRPVVLEINARFGAHSAHAPELLANLLTDAQELRPVQPLQVGAK